MAAVFSVCTSTTQFLFKGTASPLLMFSRCHHRTTASSGRLINNYRNKITNLKITPTLLSFCGQKRNSPAEERGRKKILLSCYCSEAQSNQITATKMEENGNDLDEEELKIREAANALDIRVGRIIKAWRHEEADSLYVEEVDVGEPEPRTICSGLVKYIPLHLLQDRNVIVLANLKPRNMRGVKSFGMLMAASDASHEKVELLMPPEGAVPGERVWFGSIDEKENIPDPASPNQVQKKKTWELVQPHLKTDESCAAVLSGTYPMRTTAGVIICDSLKNANIS